MKVLLTGYNGFLGNIINQKIQATCIVSTLGRRNSDYCIDLNSGKRINFTQIFDVVIHSAGKAHYLPKTSAEENSFFLINVEGTRYLLESLECSGIPKEFVFISSVSVYGLIIGENINEEYSLLSEDAYGKSKIEAEKIVKKWCEKHNVICTILRLPLVVGDNPPGNLGAMIQGIKNGYYFNIAGGNAKKSMVLAKDIARSILKVAEVGGIYNLTDGYHPSFEELSNQISIQLGKGKPMNMPLWLARIFARFGDLLGSKAPLNTNKLKKITSVLTFDDSKAREAFGWNPTPVLESFRINKN